MRLGKFFSDDVSFYLVALCYFYFPWLFEVEHHYVRDTNGPVEGKQDMVH
jgi:hypothetical protein